MYLRQKKEQLMMHQHATKSKANVNTTPQNATNKISKGSSIEELFRGPVILKHAFVEQI